VCKRKSADRKRERPKKSEHLTVFKRDYQTLHVSFKVIAAVPVATAAVAAAAAASAQRTPSFLVSSSTGVA